MNSFEDWECGVCGVKSVLKEKAEYKGSFYHECANCGERGELDPEEIEITLWEDGS